ncbi:MAG: pyridoxamine 5'-phosphate oxidase family protein [Rudaea sp.]
MRSIPMYEGSRHLQDEFATRKLAERLVERRARDAFGDDYRAVVEGRPPFLLATADAEGRSDCSYAGEVPGLMRVAEADELASRPTTATARSRASALCTSTAQVSMQFIASESSKRLRVVGRASVRRDDPLRARFDGALLGVRVHADAIFANCARSSSACGTSNPAPRRPVRVTLRDRRNARRSPNTAPLPPSDAPCGTRTP